ncbi:FadR family transcriptional regulator, partial [Mesorhizobium sp. M2D.F.Ca.ET.160.01.1.1]
LAATRATLQEVADLEAAWRGMADAGEDLAAFSRSDVVFHQIVYAASHNPIFRQIGKLIDTALLFSLEATATISPVRRMEAAVAHGEVVEALRMRDAVAARNAANKILDLAARDLTSAKKLKNN